MDFSVDVQVPSRCWGFWWNSKFGATCFGGASFELKQHMYFSVFFQHMEPIHQPYIQEKMNKSMFHHLIVSAARCLRNVPHLSLRRFLDRNQVDACLHTWGSDGARGWNAYNNILHEWKHPWIVYKYILSTTSSGNLKNISMECWLYKPLMSPRFWTELGTFVIAKVWSAGKRVSAIEGCYIEDFVKDTMIPWSYIISNV